jgi:hypothetical protein
VDNFNGFRENLQQKGFSVKIQYGGEFKPSQKNEIQDIWINKVDSNQKKNGFFFRKNVGFSLSAIDYDLGSLVRSLSQSSIKNDVSNHLKSETDESLIEIAGGLLGDFLNPTYVSQDEDELWKKKRKLRR